jgi:hypothetical protein
MNDPIVEEVRRVREEYAAQFDYDVRRIAEDLRRQEKESGRKYVQTAKPAPALTVPSNSA